MPLLLLLCWQVLVVVLAVAAAVLPVCSQLVPLEHSHWLLLPLVLRVVVVVVVLATR